MIINVTLSDLMQAQNWHYAGRKTGARRAEFGPRAASLTPLM